MTRSSLRLWFCVGGAFIAAAIADPIVESAANPRWFGPGRLTDHSNLDVLPALLAGTFLMLLYIGSARSIRDGRPSMAAHAHSRL